MLLKSALDSSFCHEQNDITFPLTPYHANSSIVNCESHVLIASQNFTPALDLSTCISGEEIDSSFPPSPVHECMLM